MVVPESKEFYLPILKFFEDKKVHKRLDAYEYVADYLNLTEELNETTINENKLKFENYIILATNHLYSATLLKKVNDGEYIISDEGLKLLNENLDSIDEDFLMRYDSFRRFKKNSLDDIKEIRILPKSKNDSCCSTLDKTIDFLSNRLITKQDCHYYFKNKFNFIGNTLILFQYENGLIGKAVFTDCVEEKSGDYKGYYIVDKDSIKIFNKKITLDELNHYVEVKGFSQVKRRIDLKYMENINKMIDDYSLNFEGGSVNDEYDIPVCVIKKYLAENNLGNLSNDDLEKSLLKFQKMFSPETLKNLEGVNILNTIFPHDSDYTTLCYNLESAEDFRSFGSISGGSVFKFSLFKYKKTNQWTVGSAKNNLKSLNEKEAIEIATKIRDALVEGADYIKNNGLNSIEDYILLEKELNNIFKDAQNYCPIKPTHVWIHKYYTLIFPDYFQRIHSEPMKKDFLNKFRIEPENGYYANDGHFMLLARKTGIKLYSLFDESIVKLFFNGNEIWDSLEKGKLVDLEDCEKGRNNFKKLKRNVIYFGAPGTGKSYNLNNDVKKIIDEDSQFERVTFHPDYSYANFVGTYKPVPDKDKERRKHTITYKYVPGPFMRSLVKAYKNPDKLFILMIEEINRANVAAVFGDVFQLLDRKDNVSEYPIQTSEDMKEYLKQEFEGTGLLENFDVISIPENMFIWATMNSADQGVFPMDTAFKRRWDFKYFKINHDEEAIENTIVILNNQQINWNDLRKEINKELLSYNLNEDKLIGPFFAFNEFKNQEIPEDIFKEVFKNKIIMYLFEDAARSKRDILFSGAKGDDKFVTYSKICDVFEDKGIGIFCDNIKDKFSNEYGE